jgi:hypothetical protein
MNGGSKLVVWTMTPPLREMIQLRNINGSLCILHLFDCMQNFRAGTHQNIVFYIKYKLYE